jgi:hypothetical protein
MDPFQYPDIPQIPFLADEQPFFFSAQEKSGQSCAPRQLPYRWVEPYREDVDQKELVSHGALSMQPMQRFLHGTDPSPFTLGLLQANLSRMKTQQGPFPGRYEQPWPSSECLTASYRHDSPERTSTSGTSSYASGNDLHSPRELHSTLFESTDSFSQGTRSFPSPDFFKPDPSPAELPLPKNSINLRDLELHHEEPEVNTDEREHLEATSEFGYDHEPAYIKVEAGTDMMSESYKPYTDSGMGDVMPVAEEVQPMAPSEESDSDWNPTSSKASKRRRSNSSRSSGKQTSGRRPRKSSTASATSNPNRVGKKTRKSTKTTSPSPNTNNPIPHRPFPCPLAPYGCPADFASKNEWKRHVSTQHIKLGFWRCDLCVATVDPHNPDTVYHNDFNRKDLFTQHLRRMHAAPAPTGKPTGREGEERVTEDNIAEIQARCYRRLRGTPPRSACLFCPREFVGKSSWEERMEHVGRHLEKEGKSSEFDVREWKRDEVLERWLLKEGLIEQDRSGAWKIGGGKPMRGFGLPHDDEEN